MLNQILSIWVKSSHFPVLQGMLDKDPVVDFLGGSIGFSDVGLVGLLTKW